MAMHVLLVEVLLPKAVWKSAKEQSGERCVLMLGTKLMPALSADN